jgi:transcriptional regulator with XRE-family HTH domain
MTETASIDGERVRARRIQLGLTQGELARRVGFRQQSLGPIEKGKVRRTGYLLELAEALNVSPEWLMGKTDDMTPEPVDQRIKTIIADVAPEDQAEAVRMLLAWRAAKRPPRDA